MPKDALVPADPPVGVNAQPVAKTPVGKPAAAQKYPFWYGGAASCLAATVTHPLDLAKARMQTSANPHQGMLRTLIVTARQAGILSIYDGLSASLLRQASYSTVRFGVYEKLKEEFLRPGETPPVYKLLPMSMFSGLVGSLVGNPADIVNVRMQNDRTLPKEQQRGYRNALDGLIKIGRAEGLQAFCRGAGPNAVRGVLMTASQVVSYDVGKVWLVKYVGMHPDSRGTFFAASLFAGFVATTVCSPADVIKTRVMNSSQNYSIWTAVVKSLRDEGIHYLFRGWTPAFVRLGPQTIVTFLAMEQLKKWTPRK